MGLTLSATAKQEIKRTLTLQLSLQIQALRADVCGNPGNHVLDALTATSELLPNELREATATVCTPFWAQEMGRGTHDLVGNKPPRIKRFAQESLYKEAGGVFSVEVERENESPMIVTLKPELGHFNEALSDPARLKETYAGNEKYVRDNPTEFTRGMQDNMRSIREALQLARLMDESLITHTALIHLLLTTGPGPGEPSPLLETLREIEILRAFDPIVSDRIFKRFVDRCRQLRKRDTSERFKTYFLNTLGEFVLISLGIIEPDIFLRCRKELDPQDLNWLQKSLSDNGLDLDAILRHYQLRAGGTLYWNRWNTRGQKATALTDEVIRAFLTKTVRQDADQIFTCFDYESAFSGWKDEVTSCGRDQDERDLADTTLKESLSDLLKASALQTKLVELMKGPWFSVLNGLLCPSRRAA